MPWAPGRQRFGRDTRNLAALLAVKIWTCEGCGMQHAARPAQCRACGRMDFIKFDSRAEANRWATLELLQAQNEIDNLRRQVRFPLLAFHETMKAPTLVGHYIADFTYRDRVDNWRLVVEDLKPNAITDLAQWKLKHFHAQYGFEVKLVKA